MKAFSILLLFCFQDGKLWNPNKESKICAQHFISGKPSFDRTKVDYVPTVFDDYQYGKHQEKEFGEKKPVTNKTSYAVENCDTVSGREKSNFYCPKKVGTAQTDTWIDAIRLTRNDNEVSFFYSGFNLYSYLLPRDQYTLS